MSKSYVRTIVAAFGFCLLANAASAVPVSLREGTSNFFEPQHESRMPARASQQFSSPHSLFGSPFNYLFGGANVLVINLRDHSLFGSLGDFLRLGGPKEILGFEFVRDVLHRSYNLIIFIWCDYHPSGTNNGGSGQQENPAATPLPAALVLFGGGLGLVGWVARRRKKPAAVLA